MKFELFHEVALTRDFPEHQLRAGDLATLVLNCINNRYSVSLGKEVDDAQAATNVELFRTGPREVGGVVAEPDPGSATG
jgi:hypothetical protein